ncbi:MAG: methionine biosynthesis protein MetW [Betaproteobacteria bacterium]|nr:methionine biosynthesis protein MetW [Betaproteobacteria bacterium]
MTDTLDRPDFNVIAGWVQPGERVLDLGCGDGALLRLLIDSRGVRGWGVEIDDARVLAAIGRGINVIQSDLEEGLADFEDGAFQHVILSLTLQAMRHTERILFEMLRVGREAVVSFPNFGYWKHRRAILDGRMPVSESLPHQWFDSPNVRFFTITDFEEFCAPRGIVIRERKVFDAGREITEEPNFLGSLAVYRLCRGA